MCSPIWIVSTMESGGEGVGMHRFGGFPFDIKILLWLTNVIMSVWSQEPIRFRVEQKNLGLGAIYKDDMVILLFSCRLVNFAEFQLRTASAASSEISASTQNIEFY